jgi:hypothetical protein
MAKCSKSTPTEADTIMCLVDDLLSSYGILGCKRHADYKAIHGRVERLLCARNEALKKTEGPYPKWAVYNGYVYRIDGPNRFVNFTDHAEVVTGDGVGKFDTCPQEIAIRTFAQLRLSKRSVAWDGYRAVVYPYMCYDKTDQVWCWSIYALIGGHLAITNAGTNFDTETAACEDLAKHLLETVWVLPATKKD